MDVLWFRLAPQAGDPDAGARPHRRRPHAGDDRPRRLLAVRLLIPKGAAERCAAGGIEAFAGDDRRGLAPVARRPRATSSQTMDDLKLLTVGGRPAGDVVEARRAVHRRRRARHVADRRRRHQPGGPGRGGRREHPRRAAARGPARRTDLAAVQARRDVPGARHAGRAGPMQNSVIAPALAGRRGRQDAAGLRLLEWFPLLRRLPARLIGARCAARARRDPADGRQWPLIDQCGGSLTSLNTP